MQPVGSLPFSQQKVSCAYSDQDQSISRPPFFLDGLFHHTIYAYVIHVVLFPQISPSKLYMHLFYPHKYHILNCIDFFELKLNFHYLSLRSWKMKYLISETEY
jgi:hypothetical protein